MIGSLEGKVEFLDYPHSIVNVCGVGYKVFLPSILFSKLNLDQKIKIFIYTHVRDDALELFGFETGEDLKLFEYLISVSGVGPKTAINIFSFGNRTSIIEAIIKGDVDFFTNVPRLGKKNAQRIIIELRGKLGSDGELNLSEEDKKANSEITQALKTFGFSAREAQEAIKAVRDQGKTTEEKIRYALKYLGK